ncbi:MAG TPA: VOC family protein [Casimicrobiaceae bacterium]|nr:VOC family protein [Casimicrobiaceae bacterium]
MPIVDQTIPVLFVQDARRSIEWFSRVLGFRVRFDYGDYVGIELDGAQIHLAERGAPDGVRLKGACQVHLVSGIEEYVAAIVAKGQVLAAPLSSGSTMHGATVRDPDGNDIYLGQLR